MRSLAEFSPEAQALLLCARPRLEAEPAERLRGLARSGLDWEWLILTARVHRVIPLLHANLLKAGANDIPPAVLASLQTECLEIAQRNLLLTGELLNILKALQRGNVHAIPFKGPTLALLAYGNLSLRKFDDLDLLIPPDAYISARQALQTLAYQGILAPGSQAEAACRKFYYECSFIRGDLGIDLHWRFTGPELSLPAFQARVWQNLQPVILAGKSVETLAPEHMLLYLCLHGTKRNHHWQRLSWICDVTGLTCQPLDWDAVLRQAGDLGMKRSLFLGLTLANHLLEAHIPEAILSTARRDPAVLHLAQDVARRLFEPVQAGEQIPERPIFYLRSQAGWRNRLRYLAVCGFWPTTEDLETANLPPFLYFVRRPFRLAAKYVSKLRRFLPFRLQPG